MAAHNAGYAALLTIPEGLELDAPIVIAGTGRDDHVKEHLVIEVGRRARATIVLRYRGDAQFMAKTDVRVGEGAALNLVLVADWDDTALHGGQAVSYTHLDVYKRQVVYHKINEELERQGVIFVDTDTGLREYPEIFEQYFATVIPAGDNKFSALNTAVWSGGSFIYVPKGVHVSIPLQAYFRINTENMGQFERTLIIADEGSYVHYVEGCTAPILSLIHI